ILDALERALSPLGCRLSLIAPDSLLWELDPSKRFHHVSDPREGPARALACAAEASSAAWLFACGGDQPNLDAALLIRLIGQADRGVEAVVLEVDGVRHPLGALYRRAALLTLTSPPTSLHGILERVRTIAIADTSFAPVIDDADTPEDADRLRLRVREF